MNIEKAQNIILIGISALIFFMLITAKTLDQILDTKKYKKVGVRS